MKNIEHYLKPGAIVPVNNETTKELVDALKEARESLAQPSGSVEQEPVAWWHDMGDVVDLNVSGRGTPLYTTPPQRTWVGLTEEDLRQIILVAVGVAEAKLKAKNFASSERFKEKNT